MPRRPLSVGINPDAVDQLVKDLGVRVRVYKSTICPNMTSLESVDHDINCKACNNSMIDFCPKDTLAMFQQQDLQQQFKMQGTFHLDECMVSFLSGVTLQQYSRVDLLDFKEDFFELIQRQEGTNIDRLKYPSCEVLGLFTVSNNITTQYFYGADFVFDINGDIEWIGAHKPADRQIYSIYYKYHPIYRAIKAVHRDRFSQWNLRPEDIDAPHLIGPDKKCYVKLPECWILKRDYLVERRDMSLNLLSANTLYDPNEEQGS